MTIIYCDLNGYSCIAISMPILPSHLVELSQSFHLHRPFRYLTQQPPDRFLRLLLLHFESAQLRVGGIECRGLELFFLFLQGWGWDGAVMVQ